MKGRPALTALLLLALLAAGCAPADTPTEPDIETAQAALVDFFALLAAGDYQGAADLHGGPEDFHQLLRDYNPDVPADDIAALLQAGCHYQFVCLEIGEVLSAGQPNENEFLFTVRFANPDGTAFVLGPCCGEDETSMPPVSEFEYTVSYHPESGEYLVLGGPVYVP